MTTSDQKNALNSAQKHGTPLQECIVSGVRYALNSDGGSYSVADFADPPISILVLPNTLFGLPVTVIKERAFKNCANLQKVIILDSVKKIGKRAFTACKRLQEITIGRGVTSIGEDAFYKCTGITRVNYGGDLKGWCEIEFESSSSNPLYDAKNAKLYVNGKEVAGAVEIPAGITKVGSRAFFKQSGITSITIPDSVTSIGRGAFYGCTGLQEVTVPGRVTRIGIYAFYGCTGLRGITIPDSVTSIGSYAFHGCAGLRRITIPGRVTSIEASAFSRCTGLQEVTIPSRVTRIGHYAFYGCTGLQKVTIPSSVTNIDDFAFENCKSLTRIDYQGMVRQWQSLKKGSDWNGKTGGEYTVYCTDEAVSKKGRVTPNAQHTSLAREQGVACVSPSINKDGVGTLNVQHTSPACEQGATCVSPSSNKGEVGTFNAQHTLPACEQGTACGGPLLGGVSCKEVEEDLRKEQKCPKKLMEFFRKVLQFCPNRGEKSDCRVWDHEKKKRKSGGTLSTQAVATGNCTHVEVGNEQATGRSPFPGVAGPFHKGSPRHKEEKAKTTTDKTNTLGSAPTQNAPLQQCIVSGVRYAQNPDGVSCSAVGLVDKLISSLVLPNMAFGVPVVAIEMEAFRGCTRLQKVTIPDSVKIIGKRAFTACRRLQEITIGRGVTSIGDGAFYKCTGITLVNYEGDLGAWCEIEFEGTSSNPLYWANHAKLYVNNDEVTGAVKIPTNTKEVGDCAFYYLTGITSVTIPDSVTSIGCSAFHGCTGLQDVTIPGRVTSIGVGAFSLCTGLQKVTIPDSVMSIGNGAFYGCAGLQKVTIPGSVASIGYAAFENCKSLTRIDYQGTTRQWQRLSKGVDWDRRIRAYTVYCTNGTVLKNGNVTPNA